MRYSPAHPPLFLCHPHARPGPAKPASCAGLGKNSGTMRSAPRYGAALLTAVDSRTNRIAWQKRTPLIRLDRAQARCATAGDLVFHGEPDGTVPRPTTPGTASCSLAMADRRPVRTAPAIHLRDRRNAICGDRGRRGSRSRPLQPYGVYDLVFSPQRARPANRLKAVSLGAAGRPENVVGFSSGRLSARARSRSTTTLMRPLRILRSTAVPPQ